MSDVKWIKLSMKMFEDEKIKLIEHMPEADTMLVIWIKLLSQAGKSNDHGYIYLSENIPYTDEMLSTIFNRPLNVVRMALGVFRQFGMIEIDEDNFISICNWEKHQNVVGLDKIREQTRQRVAKYRESKKLGLPVTLPVTDGNETDIELEEELDIDIDKERDKENVTNVPSSIYQEIIEYLNKKANTNYRATSKSTQTLIKARLKEKFTLEDFRTVIDRKSSQWINDTKMNVYLRPKTLFGTNFESYLNEKGGTSNAQYGRSNGGTTEASGTILDGRTGWIRPTEPHMPEV
ncbi:MAG: phage replisome organizer N-terminal domain-containing protein [Carnobacterium inhibens]|uniref:phage replisome organizer N-terminal domain-containing protein n=1 Tax=Carnobacterium inhibens TaxID=147709 RepID=UPI003315CDA5